jgi:hypothetical protein
MLTNPPDKFLHPSQFGALETFDILNLISVGRQPKRKVQHTPPLPKK